MNEQERLIVSAYTGYAMCDLKKIHEYIEKKLGRPVWDFEFAFNDTWEDIRNATRQDFLSLCERKEE